MSEREQQEALARAGRKLALVIAGTGVFWIAANIIGSAMGFTNRTQALFDLIALAGFAWAAWVAFGLWRVRRDMEG